MPIAKIYISIFFVKVHTPSSQKPSGSSVKFVAMRKVQDAGWTAVSKMDRKKKMKEAGKLFA